MEYQFKNGYRHALDLVNMKENKGSYANRNYMTCSKEDRQIIDMWVENARDYLVNYAGLSEDDIRQQIDELYPDGYYDYKLGQSYEDKYYEEWSRRSNVIIVVRRFSLIKSSVLIVVLLMSRL